jgi:parvulin-like peptidyl-prolyl isomerase
VLVLLLAWTLAVVAGCSRPPADEVAEEGSPAATPEAATDTGTDVGSDTGSDPEDGIDPDAIAVYDGGQVTAAELDRVILELPPNQRQSLALEDPDAYRNLVREVAVDEILLREAKLLGVDQSPEFLGQLRGIRRNLFVERYLAEKLPPIEPPTEAELRREYERRGEEYHRVERRLVYNLFRRLTPDTTKDQLRAELREVRDQVLAGQSFSTFAERISDSESRHNKGLLGWFERGQLSPDLEGVIFSLEEGVPSEPIATRDGVHLFYVDTVIEAKDFSFEEVRRGLAAQLYAERRGEAMRKLEAELEDDVEIFFPTRDELQALQRRGDPGAVVLRVGDFELRLGELGSLLETDRILNPGVVENRTERLLEALRQAERIYQHQLARGATLDAEGERQLAARADRLLALHYRQEKLRVAVDSDPARLRTFYDDNRRRFTSPLQLRLRRLSIPLAEDAAARMGSLERLVPELEAGRQTLEEAAAELSGDLQELGWVTLGQLRELDPKLARFAAGIPAGGYSPPYSTADRLSIVRVLERREPEPLPYERVRDPVRAAYLERHGQRLYEELRQELLGEAGFRFLEDRFESLIRSGLPPGATAP